jgi:hypothetical protein
VETNLPTPMTARVYVNLLEGVYIYVYIYIISSNGTSTYISQSQVPRVPPDPQADLLPQVGFWPDKGPRSAHHFWLENAENILEKGRFTYHWLVLYTVNNG